jgi:PAS domain S-box-containing protein
MNEHEIVTLESEAGFKALFEYATVGILVISSDGRIQLANPSIEKLFGYSKAELIGRSVETLIPEAFRRRHVQYREGYFSNPKARPMGYGLSLFALKKDNTAFPVEISLGHYELEDEQLAVAFVTDITIRKANEEKYLNLFENSLVAMFITDIETKKVVDVNEMGVQFFGYSSKEDFLRHFDSSYHFINQKERERNFEALYGKKTVQMTREQEMKKLDGTRFWAKIFVKLNQEKSQAQTVAIDITEAKRFNEELEAKVKERTLELTESLQREKDLNDLKSRFVSMASHEFRTPLSAILSSISLIELYKADEQAEKRIKHIERIRSSVSNLVGILNDFLSLEKLEQGKVEIMQETFDLHDFSEDIIEEVNGMLKPGQHINLHYDGDRVVAKDKRILKNVLLNLLSNAIKYSDENKEIGFSIEVKDGMACIKVKDEGIGIPEEEQKELFSKFFRAKNAVNIQGTGLGLNIVKKYVELLEGNISFNSKPNEGTTFTIVFPQNKSMI